jgi:hypothetical protein
MIHDRSDQTEHCILSFFARSCDDWEGTIYSAP